MYVIIGLMMARSWFMESNDILKDTIIDAISHIWHCIVAIYSFHLIVSSFKQRYHSILEKHSILKNSDKGRWFRVDNTIPSPPKTVPNWNFQSVHRERVPTVSITTLKESNVFLSAYNNDLLYFTLQIIFVVKILYFCCLKFGMI